MDFKIIVCSFGMELSFYVIYSNIYGRQSICTVIINYIFYNLSFFYTMFNPHQTGDPALDRGH